MTHAPRSATTVDGVRWPSRWRFTWAELRRAAVEMPAPQATPTSVWRRAAVVGACVGLGFATGHVDVFIMMAFGAIQMGLVETALPRRALLTFLVGLTLLIGVMAFVGSCVAGSWWAIPVLAVVAYAYGASVQSGVVPAVTMMGGLSIAVIFSGTNHGPHGAVVASLAVAAGAALQAVAWWCVWRSERWRFVRRALALELANTEAFLRRAAIEGRDLCTAGSAPERLQSVIANAGLPDDQRLAAYGLGEAISGVRRGVVTWMALRRPGIAARVAVESRLARLRRAMARGQSATVQPPGATASGGPGSGQWTCERVLQRAEVSLGVALDRAAPVGKRWSDRRDPGGGGAVWPLIRSFAVALHPDRPALVHGIRMAVAIAIGEAFALWVPWVHSFWVPLTIVFILKPDWSFTVLRSMTRFIGNLAAVLVLPILVGWAGGAQWMTFALICVLSLVMFRYFTGNYGLASFGLAGTILLLDETLAPNPGLYAARVWATLAAVVVAVAVAAALPTWRGRDVWPMLGRAVGDMSMWWGAVGARLADGPSGGARDPGRDVQRRLRELRERSRTSMIASRPIVEASLLEPSVGAGPRPAMLALGEIERIHESMLALSNEAYFLGEEGRELGPGAAVGTQRAALWQSVTDGFDRLEVRFERAGITAGDEPASTPLGGTASATGDPRTVAHQGRSDPKDLVSDDERTAVIAEVGRLVRSLAEAEPMIEWGLSPAIPRDV